MSVFRLVTLSLVTVLDWLLDSDPAIRWQVLRDIVRAPAEIVAAERARIATEGWGARLLALQGEDGQWVGWADIDLATLAGAIILGDGGRELVRVTF